MQKRANVRAEAATTETYTLLPGRLDTGLVLLCDHAGNAFPPGYGTLGLEQSQLERHIAYDIGAGAITRELSRRLSAPALLTHYSRLLIDLNRGLDDPTLIMRLSDGAIVPGNRYLDAAERQKRIERYYWPYHRAIGRLLDQCLASGIAPVLLSMHSFTETWRGRPRPWHVGVLWEGDDRLALPLLEAFRAEGDLIVGDNEPYAGQLEGDTLWQHGKVRGLIHAALEVRQDLIRDAAGQQAWAARLERALRSIAKQHAGLPLEFDPAPASPSKGAIPPASTYVQR